MSGLNKRPCRIRLLQFRRKSIRFFAFTMVEIIVALAILSTSVLAVFGVLRISLMANNNSQMLTKSALLAESLMSQTMLNKTVTYQTTQGKDEFFNWQIQVTPTDMDNLAAIAVKIQWIEQQKPQEFNLYSCVNISPAFEGK